MVVLAEKTAMDSLGRRRQGYIDHNMKSSCVPEPELIKKVQWEKSEHKLFYLEGPGYPQLKGNRTTHKDFKGVNFKDREGSLGW